MNLVFEDSAGLRNLVSCRDINPSGIARFTTSPVINTLLRYKQCKDKFDNINFDDIEILDNPLYHPNKKYVIASGVTHSPYDWTGPDGSGNGTCHFESDRKNLFTFLNPKYLKDLQNGRAYLLLDQSHEGYHYDWLFDWFHNSCKLFDISPQQIIYITGNMDVERQYDNYLRTKNIVDKMLVIGHAHFEQAVFTTHLNLRRFDNQIIPDYDTQLRYKKENLSKIKIYNALQKRTRAHRMWLFKSLFDADLLADGIISMNRFDRLDSYYDNKMMTKEEYEKFIHLLPILPPGIPYNEEEIRLFADQDSGKYQMRLNDDVMLDTWVSVISEASFAEDTCFISEKSFKPITIYHPFIIYGNKYSLKYLRDLGYKTFSPFIDESYDELDSWARLDAIISSLKKLQSIPLSERVDWLESMKDILHHNFQNLEENTLRYVPKSYVRLIDYFKNV